MTIHLRDAHFEAEVEAICEALDRVVDPVEPESPVIRAVRRLRLSAAARDERASYDHGAGEPASASG